MDTSTSTTTSQIVPTNPDPEEHPTFYTPLPDADKLPPASPRRPLKVFSVTLASVVFLLSLVAVIIRQGRELPPPQPHQNEASTDVGAAQAKLLPPLQPRGVTEGVSAKSNPSASVGLSFNWTNAMFSWQRTAYHFQPAKNWMNDPDGPLYHMGYYHLFYQYNPDSAVWGNITWGHAVSTDLIHWLYLPLAMVPDQWYDINGVWTGSATISPTGDIFILYTGDTNATVQVQNLALPADLSDPLLLHWVKYSGNPVIVPPTGIGKKNFRDPTTAWYVEWDQKWRVAIGSKINTTGLAFVYKTEDFYTYEKVDGVLHKVPGTGMWECVDFYPLATNGGPIGLDKSVNGPGVKHVLKASLDNTKVDHYAIGTYDPTNDTWTPDDPKEDVGIGLRVDYGRYYASKTFFDPSKQRRILWGWINETDTAEDDLEKGWASVQTVPRVVSFDTKTKSNILEWPVEEVESLRLNRTDLDDVFLEPGSVLPVDVGSATQLDIIAEFETDVGEANAAAEVTDCGGGSRDRSTFGPFGLLVIANDGLTELTPIYFQPINASDGTQATYFCADETRSSLATSVYHTVYGGKVPVLDGENFKMRLLVDHSIVESFGQGGRTVITSRIYPTEAIYGAARLFLFNNATGVNVKVTLTVWQLNSAFIRPFPFDDAR